MRVRLGLDAEVIAFAIMRHALESILERHEKEPGFTIHDAITEAWEAKVAVDRLMGDDGGA